MKSGKIAVILLVFFLLSAVCPAVGQTPPAKNRREENLKKSVGALSRAFAAADYEKLADLFYTPKDFADADADESKREKDFLTVKQMFEQTKIAGMQFTVEIQSPRRIRAVGENLFAVVPQKTIIVVEKNSRIKDGKGQIIPDGRYEASGYLLAISNNDGETWRFWNEVSKENLEREFPAAAAAGEKIKLPEIKKPYFLR